MHKSGLVLSMFLFAAGFLPNFGHAKDFSRFGYARIRGVSPKLAVARPLVNAAITIDEMKKAHRDFVAILAFPELGLTGYTAEDYFHHTEALEETRAALLKIVEASQQTEGLVTIVGAPWVSPDGRLYNAGVVIAGGKILGVVPKTHLPNYGEFYEKRWFDSGLGVQMTYPDPLFGEIHFGTNQIFIYGLIRFAVEICEDAFAVIPPSSEHALAGANLTVNLSASNELVAKAPFRRRLITGLSSQQIGAYLYVSSGPWESSRDLVFGGHVIIAENGILLAESERFRFTGSQVTVDIDFEKLLVERRRNKTFGAQRARFANNEIVIERKIPMLYELNREIVSHPFWPSDTTEQDERVKDIFDIQVTGLMRRLYATGSKTIVIGVSGGSDSTLALLVAREALKRMGRPTTDILAVTMPGFGTTSRTKDQADRLMKTVGATALEISIVAAVNQHFLDIGQDPSKHDITYENAQARERTQILFDLANKHHGIVLGTGDLSELCLGWCTYNADQISNYNVNASVLKTLVKYVIQKRALVEQDVELKKVLTDIVETAISPELLPPDKNGQIVQKSEDVFGPYEFVDFYIFYVLGERFGREKVLALGEIAFNSRYTSEQLSTWYDEINRRFQLTSRFKSTASPGGPKVGKISLSPRDSRYPDDLVNPDIINTICESKLDLH
jgi:NAD+ synthase (glutamine-hydrolysing)